jgi:hypothetical protein
MSGLECVDLHDSEKEQLMSQPEQPAGPTVLPPFCGKLNVDGKLKLRREKFKQTMENYYKDKNITSLSQLTATPPLPTPYVLAQFASKSYTDQKTRETDAQYETRLTLPDGWKLLTTASNVNIYNGYFGAAYWHPEHQQVVIAHRGSDPKILELFTDVQGVLLDYCVPQMESASTFAHKVAEVLQEVTETIGVSFQLFFTGHSSGGWLAQITTFTTEYLKTEGNIFLKSNDTQESYHPHTVVFDSPGCKAMLSEIKDAFDVRLDGRSISLKQLDITSYLSAPNSINTCNKHVGTVCRIFTDLSDMSWLEKHTALYESATNRLDKIVESFDPETGQVHKDEQGKLKIQVVVDWPFTAGFQCDKEYKCFFEWAKHLNNYHPDITDKTLGLKKYHPLRYQTKQYDERMSRLSIFSQEECQFLQDYHRLRLSPERFKPKELFFVMGSNQAQEEAKSKLHSFQIDKDTIRCTDASTLQALIAYVKRLLQLFPQIKVNTKIALSSDETRNNIRQLQTRRYHEQINQSPLKFKLDDLSLTKFLRSDQIQVLQVQMDDGEERAGLIKIHQVFQETSLVSKDQYNILTLKPSITVKELIDLNTLMLSIVTPCILLLVCEDKQVLSDEAEDILRETFRTIKERPFIKFILITPSRDCTIPRLQQIGREILGNGFVTRNGELNL